MSIKMKTKQYKYKLNYYSNTVIYYVQSQNERNIA